MEHADNVRKVFVYGTLMTGYKNHQNVVRGRFTHAERASLPGAVLWHYGGFPGMVRSPEEPHRAVYGQLLHIADDAWHQLLPELDELEGFSTPGHDGNMYERQLVKVRVHSEAGPSAVTAASDSGFSGSGAGAMPAPVPVPVEVAVSSASAASASGPDGEVVVREEVAWTYWSRIEAPTALLVPHGDWRKFMVHTGGVDLGDDWSHHLPSDEASAAAATAATVEVAAAAAAAVSAQQQKAAAADQEAAAVMQ